MKKQEQRPWLSNGVEHVCLRETVCMWGITECAGGICLFVKYSQKAKVLGVVICLFLCV